MTGPTSSRLRALLARDTLLHAPGCFDPVTAKLVEAAGFEVAYLSGAAVSAVALGEPDLGFVGMSDLVDHGRRVAGATSLPLIADADTGYGNELQVRRTVERYRAAGIAGLHLEDQTAPKRCGHMGGKQVIDPALATSRVRAAVEASDGTTVVIARTDAAGVEGLDAAIDRAVRYAAAGADLVFVEGVADEAGLARIHEAVPDVGLVLNRSEAAADAPVLDDPTLAELGVRVVIHPVSALLAAVRATTATYAAIARDGHAGTVERAPWSALTSLVGLDRELALERRYAGDDTR